MQNEHLVVAQDRAPTEWAWGEGDGLRPRNKHKPRLKVLLSSASRKGPLVSALQRAARRISADACVVAGDLDRWTPAAYVADEFWQMPRLDGGSLPLVLAECTARGINAILPSRDGELEFWARHADLFRDVGIGVVVSPLSTVVRCLDKLEFARFGQQHDLPFVRAVASLDELSTAQRIVVKERFGAGSRLLGLGLNRQAASAHGARLAQPIYQPFIEGEEISIDAWLDRTHQVKGVVLRRRDSVVNGESQVTTTFRDAHIEEDARRILEKLALCGPVVMQAVVDARGSMQIIECNARFGGASTAAVAVGLDSLYWSLLEALGRSTNALTFARCPREVRQVRMPTDLHIFTE